MGMDQVHDHGNAPFVGRIDQVHEIFRRTEPGRRGEKAGDMVAEGAVIGMLLDGHELNGVVAGIDDARQDISVNSRQEPTFSSSWAMPAWAS
jgi:hypothetical protein